MPDEDTVCRKHFPLVVSIAKRLADRHLVDDAIGAGSVALLRAIRGFDPSRGFSFTTYAVPAIRRAVLQHIRALRYPVYLPPRPYDLEAEAQITSAGTSPPVDVPIPESDPDPEDLIHSVRRVVAGLPKAQKRAVSTRYGIGADRLKGTEYGARFGQDRTAQYAAYREALPGLRADLAHLAPAPGEGGP